MRFEGETSSHEYSRSQLDFDCRYPHALLALARVVSGEWAAFVLDPPADISYIQWKFAEEKLGFIINYDIRYWTRLGSVEGE